jgi:hypothetical protein
MMSSASDEREQILRVAAVEYPEGIDSAGVSKHLDITPLRADHFLAVLVDDDGFLAWDQNTDEYTLTDEGRAHIVEHDLDV